jgi:large subunit ribosomal protein L30
MSRIKIKLVRSKSGRTVRQRRTLQALGLGKRTSSVEVEVTPVITGMIAKVNHLVDVEEI